ncbi:MAG: Flp pilus assembly protein CpaB [Coriobacteriia bacterium]|nr:Flp pilus assembly protein CpaB [Coriobacteriia bacterium]
MNSKRKRIMISVISGLLAAAMMAYYASSVKGSADQIRRQTLEAYGGEQVEVYVATRNIAAGERLTSANTAKRNWLADLLPAGALTDESDVMGQTLGMPLFANEPVVSAKLSTEIPPISVPEGYCAVSIPTNDVLAVGGAITTGSVVAIYAADKESVILLAAEILVLDTSNSSSQQVEPNSLFGSSLSRPALSWVTLSVQEDMVADLIVASRTMNLYLVLPGGEI